MHFTIQAHGCQVWLTRSTGGSERKPAFRGPREPNANGTALSLDESEHILKVV
jgi:hypothetical protein